MATGIAAALVGGRYEHPELGCFECDELYTVRVMPQLRPRALVLLNLFRDQLDRYGEIDHTQDVIDTAPVQADIGLRVGKDNMLFNVNMLLGSGEYGTSAIGGKVGFKYVF